MAKRIGTRLRFERQRAGLTQAALADGRYTKAYVSALENGLVKPSMAALNFLAGKLDITVTRLIGDPEAGWTRLEADLHLASGDWRTAADAYEVLLIDAPPSGRPELLRALAEAYGRLEQPAEALRAASEAAESFESLGRTQDAGWASYWKAFALYELEQSEEARTLLRRIDERMASGTFTDPDLRVRTAIARAMIESRDDQPEAALALLEQARSAAAELDDRRRATFLFSLALSYSEVGDFEGAIVTAQQSLAHFRAAASELEVASIENELALVYLALGVIDSAREHVAIARTGFERLANTRWLAHVTETEAQIALASGDNPEAIDLARRALAISRESDNRKAEVSALVSLARGLRAQGDASAARDALEEAAALARQHARRGQLLSVLGELASLLAEGGDLARAYALSQEALSLSRPAPASAAARVARPLPGG